jgi:acyl CoA:acetate/3-ketoacid CoA transferase alpha subunit
MAMEAEAAARAAAAMATAAAAMATAAAAMAAAEKVVEVVEVVEVVRLMGATSLIEGWAVARQQRARMQRKAVRSSRR